MARDADLYRRMYGEPAPAPAPEADPRRNPGVLAIFWPLGLLIAILASLAVALGVLVVGAASGEPELERWGVIGPDEVLIAVHAHAPDGSAGCVVTGPRLVRWDGKAPTASVDLPGATVQFDESGVHAVNGAEHVDCPFGPGEDPTRFALAAQRWSGVSPSAPSARPPGP
jgi:hypothetical protein